MGNKKRLKHNKQQGMARRARSGKRPMSRIQKNERKAARELQKKKQLELNAKKE